jgi:hypothetical protein
LHAMPSAPPHAASAASLRTTSALLSRDAGQGAVGRHGAARGIVADNLLTAATSSRRHHVNHLARLDKEALGPLRRSAYLAVKRSEAAAFAAADTAFEYRQHLMKF